MLYFVWFLICVASTVVSFHYCIRGIGWLDEGNPPPRGWGSYTYPRVLMKPLVEPSAYREQMSPMWRKLDILSDMSPGEPAGHRPGGREGTG